MNFYWCLLLLCYNNFSVSLCRFVAFFRETLETLETLCTLFALSVRTFILVPFLLYLVLFTLTLLFALFTCGRHVFDVYYSIFRLYSFSFVSFTYVPLKSKTNYQKSTINYSMLWRYFKCDDLFFRFMSLCTLYS